jgi:hypothetical protein
MKPILFIALFSLSAFAGTKRIRVCNYWQYRSDIRGWVCDMTPTYVDVVTPSATPEESKQEVKPAPTPQPEASDEVSP